MNQSVFELSRQLGERTQQSGGECHEWLRGRIYPIHGWREVGEFVLIFFPIRADAG